MSVDDWSVRLSPDLADDYLSIAQSRGGPKAVEKTALRTRSRAARDLLAYAAAPGHLTASELIATIHAATAPNARGSAALPPPVLDLDWTISLARVIGMQNLEASDLSDAVLLLEELRRQHGPAAFDRAAQQTVVDRLWQAGEHELLRSRLRELKELRPDVRQYLRADLTNPFIHQDAVTPRARARLRTTWQRQVDKIFAENGVEPVAVTDGAATAFDGLTCEVDDPINDMPRVSVIMTAFRPGPELITSVRSMCDQTWRNLEMLIIDDASGPMYDDVLDACAALDPRVHVHRLEHNGGTYLARNAALDIATGEFVTCQDADDWSHPRRIELQAKALLADPTTPATRSCCLRVSPDLIFQRPGYETLQENASSLMFRREQVLATIGYFDGSRKSADTEFRKRLELVTGSVTTDLPAPLAMVRMAGGSLSRGDFTPGWHHVSRFMYRGAYERWHARLAAGADPYLPRCQNTRQFALPQRFQIDQAAIADQPPHYDVVLLGDWLQYGATQRSMVEEIRALTRTGYRVGVGHMVSYQFMSRRREPLCPQILDLISDGTVDFVALDQAAAVTLLVVRTPSVLQFATAETSTLDVDQVVVVADRAPHAKDGSSRQYTPATCDATVRDVFHTEPVWIPQGPAIRSMLAEMIPSRRLRSRDMPGIIDVDAWHVPRHKFRADRPVLGRQSQDGHMTWPTSGDDVLVVDSDDDTIDARITSGDLAATTVIDMPEVPSDWASFHREEISAWQFFRQLDFYAYVPLPHTVEAFDNPVAKAIASGCVAILPRHLEPYFGAAAIYTDPDDAPQIARNLHEDWQAYREQVDRGLVFVRDRFGQEAYLAEISDLIGPPHPCEDLPGHGRSVSSPQDPNSARPRHQELPAGAAAKAPGDVSLILLVRQPAAARLSATLARIRDSERLPGMPVTVVYTPDAQMDVDVAKVMQDAPAYVLAEDDSRESLAAAACQQLRGTDARYVCIANLPRVQHVWSWSGAVQREVDRLRRIDLVKPLDPESNAPLLVWSDNCTPEVAAAYIHHVLTTAEVEAGALADFLGGVALAAGSPRLEAADPRDGEVELFAWLAAKFSPDMPEPPWRYRFALSGPEGVIRSQPTTLTQRVNNRGKQVWENLTSRLPLDEAADGNHTLAIEVDTNVPGLEAMQTVRPAKGVLLNARTVVMRIRRRASKGSTRRGDRTLRYLVHARGSNVTHITTHTGRDPGARLRWAATLVKKDLGNLRRRDGSRRMRLLRLVRLATRPFFARKQIWIIGERTDTAQDNGLHLFRHLRQTHPRRHVYYVIDKSSPQYERVAGLGHVVAHSSRRHQLLMLHATVLANAYSIRYMTPESWGQANYVRHLAWRVGALRVYLKHGVHLSPSAVKRGMSGYDLFLTVMPRESAALRAVSGYNDQIAEIGMPRFDGLIPAPQSRTVLFMPTWRQYLVPRLSGEEHVGQIPFVGSAYEQFMTGFVTSPRLRDILEKYDYRLTFLPHYNMASHFDTAVQAADRINVADTNMTSFQDLLRGCDAFITDYSSVHFDVAYLGTPVIYARFDHEDYETRHASPSWFDYERDGFGPVAHTLDDTLDSLQRTLEQDCAVADEYAARVDAAFTFRDRENCARAVAAIDGLSTS